MFPHKKDKLSLALEYRGEFIMGRKKLVMFLVVIFSLITDLTFASPGGKALAESMGQFGQSLTSLALSMMRQSSYPLVSNFDLAFPPFTDQQKYECLKNSFYVDNYGNYMISLNKVSEEAFLTQIGLVGYADSLKAFKKRDKIWGISTLSTGVIMIVSYVVWGLGTDPSFSNPFAIPALLGTAGFTILLTGGLINYFNAPQISFEIVASSANIMNRQYLEQHNNINNQ
jgi:hypothetical protein